MSIIFGAIDTRKKSISDIIVNKYNDEITKYKIDNLKIQKKNNIIIGCGIQYVTNEFSKDMFQIADDNNFFVFDGIIDNRKYLLELLSYKDETHVTNSKLVFEIIKKYKDDAPKYLLGEFSFVYYDFNSNIIYLCRDHIGKRTLYYYFTNGILFFSTTINMIVKASNCKFLPNDRWVNDFLAIDGLAQVSECNETIYKDIFQVGPAEIIKIENNVFNSKIYWNPTKNIKILKLDSDEEYKRAFHNIMNQIIADYTNTDANVGVMLSSGLDSSTVSVFASQNLKRRGKKLYTYTSVPLKSYSSHRDKYFKVDESKEVIELSQLLGNCTTKFCDSEGLNSFENIDEFLRILEFPYKAVQNTFWINNIISKASKDGCKILLNGQYGNATISYGDFFVHLISLIKSLKVVRAKNEIDCYCKKNRIRKKNLVKYLVSNTILQKFKFKYSRNVMFDGVLNNKDILETYNTYRRFKKLNLNSKFQGIYDLKKMKKILFNRIALSQLGEMETKFSLEYGIVIRDPTRDKRIIEFCLSLPTDQFVNCGVDRRLIREYMKDYLPKSIVDEKDHRGLQSADWIFRLKNNWNDIYKEMVKSCKCSYINKYIDIEKLNRLEQLVCKEPTEENENYIRRLINVYTLAIFLNNNFTEAD